MEERDEGKTVENTENAVKSTENGVDLTEEHGASELSCEAGELIFGEEGNRELAEGGNKEQKQTSEELPSSKELKKKRLKKILGYAIFILVNALVVGVLILLEDKGGDIIAGQEVFARLGENWIYTVLAFSMFFIIVICDSIVFKTLIYKTGKEHRNGLALKVTLFGRYYDRITPWSMGGEPFQVAYLMRGGLSTADSCAVTMSRHIVRFFTNAILVIVILTASRIATEIWVMVVAILSVLAGLIIPIFMLVCSFKPVVGMKIGSGVVNLLYKLKLVKDKDKMMTKIQKDIDNFLSGIRYLSTNKQIIALIAIAAIIELFATNSVPFLVIRALGHSEAQFWKVFVLCIFVNYASSFAPTPGGAGIAELSFYAIFAATIEEGYLFWAVLTWRVAVFYIPVFIGFALSVADSVAAIIKASKKPDQA